MIHRNVLIIVILATLLITPVIAIDYTIDYDPQTGTYTHLWFDPDHPPNVYNLFYSLFLPLTTLIGDWTYFILWGLFVMALWLYTQDITLPFAVGTISGYLISTALITLPEAKIVMFIAMAFCAGGILAKVLVGR